MANPNTAAIMALGLIGFVYLIFWFGTFLPGLGTRVRRSRDAGFHWALHFVFYSICWRYRLYGATIAMPIKAIQR